MFERLLVPLDGSEAAARALGPAEQIADVVDSPLRVVSYVTTLTGQEVSDAIGAQLDEVDLADVSVGISEPTASVASALVNEVRAVPGTMVVMTGRGAGRTGAALGTVADAFLQKGFGPVLLVGPECVPGRFRPGGTVVVPLDGSDRAASILPVVASWSMVVGGTPELVTVIDPSAPIPGGSRRAGDDVLESNLVRAAATQLSTDIGRQVGYEVLHGSNAAKAIVTHAADTEASMIALATHGRTGLSRLVAGSVAMSVIHRAPCPVLVYRPPHLQ